MFMRSTNHMILIRDHSHDQLTWFWQVTYKVHPNNKSSSIPTSAWSFLCHKYILVFYLSLLLHLFIIMAHVFNLAWASSQMLWKRTRKIISRSMPVLDLVLITWGECPQLLQEKTIGKSHEWSGKGQQLARCGLVWPFGISISASTMIYHTTQ